MAKSLFNISFPFLFFSFITKVECGKISHDKSQSHRVTEMSCHIHVTIKSQVTVTVCDRGVS